MLASNALRVPPSPSDIPLGWSGAPETIVHYITEKLVEMGHDVTLFASGDTVTKAKLVSISAKSSYGSGHLEDHKQNEYMLVSKAYKLAQEGNFDIIHSHFDDVTSYFAPLVSTPTVSTLHSPIGLTANKEVLHHFKDTQWYVSISNSQREGIPDLNYIATVYNGMSFDDIPFSSVKEDFIIYAGRIMPEKGTDIAIRVALKANVPLYIFGSVNKDSEYWKKEIEPFIDDKKIMYMGMIPRPELLKYMSKAKAFLMPIRWKEPFGLVVIEAMATGTPTIAFPNGSMSEIIDDGETGYLVKDEKEMIQKLKDLNLINPQLCRDRASARFNIDTMVAGYEKAYYDILNKL